MKHIVQFKNKKYAIRKGNSIFGYKYLDLKSGHKFWWSRESIFFNDCLTNDLTKLQKIDSQDSKDYGKIIK